MINLGGDAVLVANHQVVQDDVLFLRQSAQISCCSCFTYIADGLCRYTNSSNSPNQQDD